MYVCVCSEFGEFPARSDTAAVAIAVHGVCIDQLRFANFRSLFCVTCADERRRDPMDLLLHRTRYEFYAVRVAAQTSDKPIIYMRVHICSPYHMKSFFGF